MVALAITSTMPAIFIDSANESQIIFRVSVLVPGGQDRAGDAECRGPDGVQMPAIRKPITTAGIRLIGMSPHRAPLSRGGPRAPVVGRRDSGSADARDDVRRTGRGNKRKDSAISSADRGVSSADDDHEDRGGMTARARAAGRVRSSAGIAPRSTVAGRLRPSMAHAHRRARQRADEGVSAIGVCSGRAPCRSACRGRATSIAPGGTGTHPSR
jgi:hypothetical protein